MDIGSALLIYFLIWWLVIFCVLPWGVRTHVEGGVGAPVNAHLKKKFLITTGISFLIWLLVLGLVKAEIVDFRGISQEMAREDSR